jgi:hypothetical protein
MVSDTFNYWRDMYVYHAQSVFPDVFTSLTEDAETVEVLGFVGRILSTNDFWALGPFIMQSLLLLVAPALFAASIYIILGRIILLTDGEKHSLIRQKWLTKIFVVGDCISFLAQCGGGGIQAAGSLTMLHTGEKIIVVGLFLQLAFFGFFVVVAGLFHWRLAKAGSYTVPLHDLPWKRHVSTCPEHTNNDIFTDCATRCTHFTLHLD